MRASFFVSDSCYDPCVPLPPELLEVLVCPRSKAPLLYFAHGEAGDDGAQEFLLCPSSKLRYRVDAGVPVMLVEEATSLSDDEHARLGAIVADQQIPPTFGA